MCLGMTGLFVRPGVEGSATMPHGMLVDSGSLHQGHFGTMVHPSPGTFFKGPGLHFLNFQQGNTRALKS